RHRGDGFRGGQRLVAHDPYCFPTASSRRSSVSNDGGSTVSTRSVGSGSLCWLTIWVKYLGSWVRKPKVAASEGSSGSVVSSCPIWSPALFSDTRVCLE